MAEKIEHRIGIGAPASVIWEVVSRFLGLALTGDPVYPKGAGNLSYGARLTVTQALPGLAPREITPAVLDWTPDEALHWRRTFYRGFGWAIRFLEIESISATGCIFSNGELYGGWLGPRAVRPIRRAVRAGCVALGEAVKRKAR